MSRVYTAIRKPLPTVKEELSLNDVKPQLYQQATAQLCHNKSVGYTMFI